MLDGYLVIEFCNVLIVVTNGIYRFSISLPISLRHFQLEVSLNAYRHFNTNFNLF